MFKKMEKKKKKKIIIITIIIIVMRGRESGVELRLHGDEVAMTLTSNKRRTSRMFSAVSAANSSSYSLKYFSIE